MNNVHVEHTRHRLGTFLGCGHIAIGAYLLFLDIFLRTVGRLTSQNDGPGMSAVPTNTLHLGQIVSVLYLAHLFRVSLVVSNGRSTRDGIT
jgi:hypothetical protein